MKIEVNRGPYIRVAPTQEEFDKNINLSSMLFAGLAYRVAMNKKYGILQKGDVWGACKRAWLWYYYLNTITMDTLLASEVTRIQYWNVVARMSEIGNDYNWPTPQNT